MSGPIHQGFSLFAQKIGEVGSAVATPMRAIPASPSLFALVWGRARAHRREWRVAGRPATAPGQAQETVSGRCSGAASPCYLLWCAWASLLQIGVVGARAALGRRPDDILAGILDVAGFAVNAVGGVDLQPWQGIPIKDLEHPRRAVALGGFGPGGQIDLDRNARVLKGQVTGLILVVAGAGHVSVR